MQLKQLVQLTLPHSIYGFTQQGINGNDQIRESNEMCGQQQIQSSGLPFCCDHDPMNEFLESCISTGHLDPPASPRDPHILVVFVVHGHHVNDFIIVIFDLGEAI